MQIAQRKVYKSLASMVLVSQLLYLLLAVFHFAYVPHRWCPIHNRFEDVAPEDAGNVYRATPSTDMDAPNSIWGRFRKYIHEDDIECPILSLFSSYQNGSTENSNQVIDGDNTEANQVSCIIISTGGPSVFSYSPKHSPPPLPFKT